MSSFQNQNFYKRSSGLVERNGLLYAPSKDGNSFYEVSRSMKIVKVIKDLVSMKYTIMLQYQNINGDTEFVMLPREILNKTKMQNVLPSFGMSVTDLNSNILLEHLLASECTAVKEFSHNQVGWFMLDNKRVFLTDKIIGSDKQSIYSGTVGVGSRGSLENEIKTYQECVLGHTATEVALVFGFSSPVTSLIKELKGTMNPFISIYGLSSTGKTSVLNLCGAPWGNGLVRTWNSTATSIVTANKGIFGIPMLFDESTIGENKLDFMGLVYTLAEGKDKMRSTVAGELRPITVFAGTFVSTGESSVIGSTQRHPGLKMRTMEYGEVMWTRSPENSRELKDRISEDFGNSGPKFVEYLIKLGDEEILKLYEECKTTVYNKLINVGRFRDRLTDRNAQMLLTAKLVRAALQIDLNVEGILKFLVDNENGRGDELDIGRQAYDYFVSEMTRNNSKFAYNKEVPQHLQCYGGKSNKEMPKSEFWGSIEYINDIPVQVLITKESLESILAKGKITDLGTILKLWKEAGVLDHDPNKLSRKKSLVKGLPSVRVYVIKLDNHKYVTNDDIIPDFEEKKIFIKELVDEIIEEDIV